MRFEYIQTVCVKHNKYATLKRKLYVMSKLSKNLAVRREALGLSVPQVQQELNRMGFNVAFSTVAGWFNGNRGVRKMEHLKALCKILKTDLNALTKDDMEAADSPINIAIVREIAGLTPIQQAAVLATIRAMKG